MQRALHVWEAEQLWNSGAHDDIASQWSVDTFSTSSSDRSSDSNESAAGAGVVDVDPVTFPQPVPVAFPQPVTSSQHAHEQPQEASVESGTSPQCARGWADRGLERDDGGKYAHEQPRADETGYAALHRLVGALKETLLRMNAGHQAVAQQMQHDFTLKLQFAQTSFAQQLIAVQGPKGLITPMVHIAAVGGRCKVAV